MWGSAADMDPSIRFRDMLYFLAELAVYAAVAWWGFTRDAPLALRLLLGLGGVIAFAVSWAVLASPKASIPLRGLANVAFRAGWVGLGAVAGMVVVLGN